MLDHYYGIGAWGQRRTSHDFKRVTRRKRRKAAISSAYFAGYTKRPRKIFAVNRKPVAERAIQRRIVTIRQNIFGEHAAIREFQSQCFRPARRR
jgi:hypothetical protein